MTRSWWFVVCALVCAVASRPSSADDPPKKLTAEERKELEVKWGDWNRAGLKSYQMGKYPESESSFASALEVARQLYPRETFPNGHASLATSMANLAAALNNQGRMAGAESLARDALTMRRQLFKGDSAYVLISLNTLGQIYQVQGQYSDAEPLLEEALQISRRIFNIGGSRLDDATLALCMNNLAHLYQLQGRFTEAEPLFEEALGMTRRLFKGDHADVARGLHNLAMLRMKQGKLTEAEPLLQDAVEMYKRVFKSDHPFIAQSLINLAELNVRRSRLPAAESQYDEALKMLNRVYKGDHPAVAQCENNLARLYQFQGKFANSESLYRDCLEMYKRVFKRDHREIAASLNNLAYVSMREGKFSEAEPRYAEALEMFQRVYRADHLDIAYVLNNQAALYLKQKQFEKAERASRDAVAMARRLATLYAGQKSEGDALTLAASLPLFRDNLLTIASKRKADPASIYSVVWASKGFIARVYEHRHQQARSALDAGTMDLLSKLAAARRRRAELLLAPPSVDIATRKKYDDDLKNCEESIAAFTKIIILRMPSVDRDNAIAAANPDDLQRALPTDTVVVDYVRYFRFEEDKSVPGITGEKLVPRFLAFIVTRDMYAWADLDGASAIENVVLGWREALISGKEIPVPLSAKVRELLWEKVRKELPPNIKTLYICPDAALCRVPWGAIPGDKPGTVLLDDYAIATIPHAQFLLDKLLPQDPPKNPPANALVVGGVAYDAAVQGNAKTVASRGEPLLKADVTPAWAFLPGTVGESNGVAATAERKHVPIVRLTGDSATPQAILAALPKSKYAHIATHGFFADASFRSAFQLDEKEFAVAQWGERIGRAANSPLVMTGLVFAGANNPKTPGRGILTGEALIDLDLSGLELAVLSACETGLGDVAGGEGTFGLQRAFHMAGTRDVVASLWKVPDQSTAALMALFYRNLWEKNLSPMESLRQAQLEIYRNPGRIDELAKGFRGKFEEVAGKGNVDIKPSKDGTAHPLLWAAFTLSGPGR